MAVMCAVLTSLMFETESDGEEMDVIESMFSSALPAASKKKKTVP